MYSAMAVQNFHEYVSETVHEEPLPVLPVPNAIPPEDLPAHDSYEKRSTGRSRQDTVGPRTPSGSDNESDRHRRRRSPRRRRSSGDSDHCRSRSPDHRRSRYFEEYRPRRRFEHDLYRPSWSYGPYMNDCRSRGRTFSWWRGSGRGYGGPRYSRGRGGWYGGYDRRPRFYQPPRYPGKYHSRPRGNIWYDDCYDYVRERSQGRVHRRREDYDEERRSRRNHDHDRPMREETVSEEKRSHVTSSRTVPADYFKQDMRPESTNNNNYPEIYT